MAHRSGARAIRRERGAAVGVSHVPECKRAATTCSRSAVTGGAAGTADDRRTCFRERSAGASRVTARSASRHAHLGASAPAGRNMRQSKAVAGAPARYRERSVCGSHVPVTRRVPPAPVPAAQRRHCGRGRHRARSHVPGTQRSLPTCYRAVSTASGAGTLPRVLSARSDRSASARTVIRDVPSPPVTALAGEPTKAVSAASAGGRPCCHADVNAGSLVLVRDFAYTGLRIRPCGPVGLAHGLCFASGTRDDHGRIEGNEGRAGDGR